MTNISFLKSIISTRDPIAVVFDESRKFWSYTNTTPISAFFESREREFNRFEHFLSDIYYEIYQTLFDCIKRAKNEDRFDPKYKAVIILDGFSLREAGLLIPEFKQNGYDLLEYSYNFSTMPSDTQTYVKKVFGVSTLSFLKQWKDYKILHIVSGQIPQFLPKHDRFIVWLSFPDELLHYTRGQVMTPEEVFNKTKVALFEILKLLNTDEFLITSDHGYIYSKSARLFWKAHREDEKILRQIFKGRRGIRFDDIELCDRRIIEDLMKIPESESYIIVDEEAGYIKGRYWWSVSGRQSDICHGGLSLMECYVPVLKIKKNLK